MTNNAVPDPTPERELFGNLLASKPPKQRQVMATAISVVAHGGVIAGLVWATLAMAHESVDVVEEQITLFNLVEEAPPPPPPPEEEPPPMPDVPPPPSSVQIDLPQGFQTLTAPDIVPVDIPPPDYSRVYREADFSGQGIEGGVADGNPDNKTPPPEDIMVAPSFTPMTVAPQLRNVREVQRALERHYPPLLRDAGIGGTVVLWFLIDEKGTVIKTQLHTSSGHPALDEAAPKVAEVMRFSPALNRDQPVMVWVEMPIRFQVQ